jgi:tol-pal system protein YbgF
MNDKQSLEKPMAAFFVPVLIALLGLSGCAAKEDISWQQDKDLVLESLKGLQQNQTQSQEHVTLLDTRVMELEKTVAKQEATIAAMTATLASLKDNKAKKRNVRSSLGHKASRKSTRTKKALTKKIDHLQNQIQQTAIKNNVDVAAKEKESYTAAYLALKSGRYDEAANAFKVFLDTYPNGEYADQAYYWMGESLLAKGEFLASVPAFQSLIKNYPQSSKYQAGLLKLAIAYQEGGRIGDAKAVLQRLIREYPESKAAERARVRLSELNAGKK